MLALPLDLEIQPLERPHRDQVRDARNLAHLR